MRTLRMLLSFAACLACLACRAEPIADAGDGQPAPRAVVWVVRHAESWKNVEPQPLLPEGQLDDLTQRGTRQAEALGARLAARGVTAVRHSPTGRTAATARIIGAATGAPVEPTAALAALEAGLTPDGMAVDWTWRKAAWASGADPQPQGGESLADGAARAVALLDALEPGARVVLVTHGDIAAALLGHAAGTPMPARFARHEPPTGSVTELTWRADGTWQLGPTWTAPLE